MLISPAKAAAKACVHAPNEVTGVMQCVGDHCMAWRGAESGDGYCGLAGRPLKVELLHMKRAIVEVVPFAKEVAKL